MTFMPKYKVPFEWAPQWLRIILMKIFPGKVKIPFKQIDKLELPAVKESFPGIPVDDLVSVQPLMGAEIPPMRIEYRRTNRVVAWWHKWWW